MGEGDTCDTDNEADYVFVGGGQQTDLYDLVGGLSEGSPSLSDCAGVPPSTPLTTWIGTFHGDFVDTHGSELELVPGKPRTAHAIAHAPRTTSRSCAARVCVHRCTPFNADAARL